MVSSAIALWLLTPAIRVEVPPGPADNSIVLGLDAAVDALDSQVCALFTELLEECIEWDDEVDRCVYVDHGQCGRESGDGRPGEFEIEPGREVDIVKVVKDVYVPSSLYVARTAVGDEAREALKRNQLKADNAQRHRVRRVGRVFTRDQRGSLAIVLAKDETTQATSTLHPSIGLPNDVGQHASHYLPVLDRFLLLPLSQRVHHILQDELLAFVFRDVVADLRDVSFVFAQTVEDVTTEVGSQEVGLRGPTELQGIRRWRAEEHLLEERSEDRHDTMTWSTLTQFTNSLLMSPCDSKAS